MENKFKIGDKVRNKKTGEINIVKSVPGMEEYDRFSFGCASQGFVSEDYGWQYQENWELVSEPQQDTIVHCPTKELWEKVQREFFSRGIYWRDGSKEIFDGWDNHGKETCIDCENGKLEYSPKDYYQRGYYQKDYSHLPIISAEEFLRENIKLTSTPKSIMGGNKIMSAITKAFKSKENKALEHYGLGSTCELNQTGLGEFLAYIYETDKEAKAGFLAKMVEAHEEDTKKK